MNNGQTLDFAEKKRGTRSKKLLKRNMWITTAFFSASIFLQEIMTAVFTCGLDFAQFFMIVINTLAVGSVLAVVLSFISSMKARNWVAGVVSVINAVIFCAQICYHHVFGQFFEWETIGMAGNLFKDFWHESLVAIWECLLKIILIFVPFVLFIVFRKRFGMFKACKSYIRMRWILVFIASLLLCLFFTFVPRTARETYLEGETNKVTGTFGVMTSTRRGIEQLIFGKSTYSPPSHETEGVVTPPPAKTDTNDTDEPPVSGTESGTETTEPPVVIEGDNVLEIDFDSLIAENSGNKDVVALLKYFQSREPTNKNEYTGYFEGKNLIFMSLESFCGEFISEELTPTLYMMTHSGFMFSNYYNSLWGGSTSTGEFANLSGMFYNSANAMKTIGDHALPFALGNQFLKLGYHTFAFHANSVTYYNRTYAYPALGYQYYYGRGGTTVLDPVTRSVQTLKTGIEEFTDADGNGWTMKAKGTKPQWPESDHELAKLTISKFVDQQPFHVYYMTISGHCNYNWAGNDMCSKHRSEVEGLKYKNEEVKAFIACNLEVELMLKQLIDDLDAAGILDNTVFVMTADHYPYEMSDESLAELYDLPVNNIRTNFELYRNELIIWCSSMKKPVKVDKVCSAIDILPTVSNLFGLPYDSRMLAGVDVLSDATPVAIINTLQKLNGSYIDWCWITDYGYKKSSFVANEAYEWTSESKSAYAKGISSRVSSMKNYFFKALSTDFYKYLKLD